MADGCLFCAIVAGDIDADIVHRDEHVVAFRDLNPQAPTHVLVVPTTHAADWVELARQAADEAAPLMAGVADVAEALGLEDFRVVANRGAGAGQSVFHLHLHVLAGRPLSWPPG